MKLLFDENLSFKICRRLSDRFPNSTQVRLVGLERADDRTVWDYAKANGFVLVTSMPTSSTWPAFLGRRRK
jgi:predicted nuclease of predicted toxin-antitoxin system